ncbi:hypothetical protein [Streptomyces sp. NPDC006668]|uniref:hypothetical protein n=1 Tax=Streptomyces sp. NPDC006668 TaxID=3156903 RepID=UPI0033CE7E11
MPDSNQHQRPTPLIESRVCIDDSFGPFSAKLDPTDREGYLTPFFTLDTVRELAVCTQQLCAEYGRDSETIHVLSILDVADSRAGHEDQPRVVVVQIRWQYLDEGAESAVSIIEPNQDGLYQIGSDDWAWGFVTWSCPRGSQTPWHLPHCDCCHALRPEVVGTDTAGPD